MSLTMNRLRLRLTALCLLSCAFAASVSDEARAQANDMAIQALLTPADPMSMVLLAIPLYGLFELGGLLLVLLPAERVARGTLEPDGEADDGFHEPGGDRDA